MIFWIALVLSLTGIIFDSMHLLKLFPTGHFESAYKYYSSMLFSLNSDSRKCIIVLNDRVQSTGKVYLHKFHWNQWKQRNRTHIWKYMFLRSFHSFQRNFCKKTSRWIFFLDSKCLFWFKQKIREKENCSHSIEINGLWFEQCEKGKESVSEDDEDTFIVNGFLNSFNWCLYLIQEYVVSLLG